MEKEREIMEEKGSEAKREKIGKKDIRAWKWNQAFYLRCSVWHRVWEIDPCKSCGYIYFSFTEDVLLSQLHAVIASSKAVKKLKSVKFSKSSERVFDGFRKPKRFDDRLFASHVRLVQGLWGSVVTLVTGPSSRIIFCCCYSASLVVQRVFPKQKMKNNLPLGVRHLLK